MGKKSNQSKKTGKKHPKPHIGIKNPDRRNGKAWKQGKAPSER